MKFVQGDLFASGAEAIINPVNCVGVMGKGLALAFKQRHPANFRAYKQACDTGELKPGRLLIVETGQMQPRLIINFPTKRHWRAKSRLDDVAAGLRTLKSEVQRHRISSLAIPALGAGLGGLDWAEVRAAIELELAGLENVQIMVFEPQ